MKELRVIFILFLLLNSKLSYSDGKFSYSPLENCKLYLETGDVSYLEGDLHHNAGFSSDFGECNNDRNKQNIIVSTIDASIEYYKTVGDSIKDSNNDSKTLYESLALDLVKLRDSSYKPPINYQLYINKAYALAGNHHAQNNLGMYYLEGKIGLDKDYKKSFFWFHNAALSGNPSGKYNLSWQYVTGDGVTKNYDKAKYWLVEAKKSGVKEADNALLNLDDIFYKKDSNYSQSGSGLGELASLSAKLIFGEKALKSMGESMKENNSSLTINIYKDGFIFRDAAKKAKLKITGPNYFEYETETDGDGIFSQPGIARLDFIKPGKYIITSPLMNGETSVYIEKGQNKYLEIELY